MSQFKQWKNIFWGITITELNQSTEKPWKDFTKYLTISTANDPTLDLPWAEGDYQLNGVNVCGGLWCRLIESRVLQSNSRSLQLSLPLKGQVSFSTVLHTPCSLKIFFYSSYWKTKWRKARSLILQIQYLYFRLQTN